MKESVHNVRTETLHVHFKAVYRGGHLLPYLSLLSSVGCLHGHRRARLHISIRVGAISHMKEISGQNWRLYHESSALRQELQWSLLNKVNVSVAWVM